MDQEYKNFSDDLRGVLRWLKNAKLNHEYGGSTGSLITALRRIQPIADELSFRTPKQILSEIDYIFHVLENRTEDLTPRALRTLGVYKSRVKRALFDFIVWKENRLSRRGNIDKRQLALLTKQAMPEVGHIREDYRARQRARNFSYHQSRLLLPNGETFTFSQPSPDFTVRDASIVFAHLLSHPTMSHSTRQKIRFLPLRIC
jgi:hypothetical protein